MAKILCIIFLLLVAMMSIHKLTAEGKSKMDRYEWLPTESAYEKYPMSIIKGDLIFDDGTSIYIPSRKTMVNGWGKIGSIHIVGEKFKPLPVKMEVSYFSFAEDKFYSGGFSLPYEKISKLFREGLQSPATGKRITYQNIIVGVAPAGEISVWLMADGEVLLVANFRAKEKMMDWKSVTENEEISRSDYIKEVLDFSLSKDQVSELAQHGIPYAKLEAFGKQYSWNPEVIGSNPVNLWLKTYNGECEFIDFLKVGQKRRNIRAIPKQIDINWQDRFGIKYKGYITFNEAEVLKAYQKLSTGQADHELKLQLEINEKTSDINMSLNDSKFSYKFEKSVIKIYLK